VTGKQVAGLCEREPILVTILLLISILAAHKIKVTTTEGCMATAYGGVVCL
jgi:hypothetical protein